MILFITKQLIQFNNKNYTSCSQKKNIKQQLSPQ